MTDYEPRQTRPAAPQHTPAIDDDGVPASLAARMVRPGDPNYHRFTASYLRSGAPALVLRPETPAQVQDSVRFAHTQRDVPLGIFSAGHGLSGRSLNHGGLVIDVSALNHVEPLGGRLVSVGPGARWIDVARVLTPLQLAVTSGDYGGVGVGGLATAGGIGWFAREHGLTIDHLRSVDVVTADGELVHASKTSNAELFWAMRGAGPNFGIAVSFEFEAKPVAQIGFAQLTFAISNVASFIERWGAAVEASDRSVSATVLLGGSRPGQLSYAMATVVVDSAEPDTVTRRLQPILKVDRLANQSITLATYEEVMGAFFEEGSAQQGQGEPHAHSAFVRHLDPQTASGIAAFLSSGATSFFTMRSVGAAVSDIPADDTAYGWRDANFSLVAFGSANSGIDEWWDHLQPHFEGLYLSFESDITPESLARAFPPAHLERLRELKRRYDATGLFRDNFFIDPKGRLG
ncbi:MAG: class flavin-dependent oxidoreductase [Subtercola sp.]|nr:class flavin-dependent oxidoreductase [Subtercola sp.]